MQYTLNWEDMKASSLCNNQKKKEAVDCRASNPTTTITAIKKELSRILKVINSSLTNLKVIECLYDC